MESVPLDDPEPSVHALTESSSDYDSAFSDDDLPDDHFMLQVFDHSNGVPLPPCEPGCMICAYADCPERDTAHYMLDQCPSCRYLNRNTRPRTH